MGKPGPVKSWKLRTRLLISSLVAIVVLTLSVAILGYYVIENEFTNRAQAQVRNDLNSAREIYQHQVKSIKDVVRFTAERFFIRDAISEKDQDILKRELGRIREAESLDVLTVTDAVGKVVIRSRNPTVSGDNQADDELVAGILSSKQVIAGTHIVSSEELAKEGNDLAEQARIRLIPTTKAKQRTGVEEASGMMIRAGAPVFGYDGGLIGVLHGGILLNRNYTIVDKIKETVYEGIQYKGIDTGTATIFQGDLRISTNVRTKEGKRAIGTRVSEEVYERVLTGGMQWVDRAFVVTNWFKTAYEPIKDINGEIVGILYVGILEQPFVDMSRNIFLFFVAIVSVAAFLSGFFAMLLARVISRPVLEMVKATRRLSDGELGYEVGKETGTIELDTLAKSFNKMSTQLRQREESLKALNERLTALNKTYLDLVGFVSHELKGIVATTIMNAAAVRDGLFGQINPQQKRSLEAVTKSLHYFRETVKKFLDLSRIEKGELEINRTAVRIFEDVFEPCLETFASEIAERRMDVTNNIAAEITVQGDLDLLRIAANNLVGNAIKYGLDGGKVILSSEVIAGKVRIEIYNDSRPIGKDEKAKLFKKFSRLQNPGEKTVKGTGLGLFVTKEIIVKHGGNIRVEPRENGNSFIFEIEKNSETP